MITLDDQLRAVNREIAMCRAVYPKRIAEGKMKPEQADHEIEAMQAVLASLQAMPPLRDGLTFNALRRANMARLPHFRNRRGELSHSEQDGSDWTPAQWLQALVGELGEFANFRKKFERGDISFEEYEILASKELADVQTYLDILASRCLDEPGAPHMQGVDLGRATIEKFNEVSERVRCNIRIRVDGTDFIRVPWLSPA